MSSPSAALQLSWCNIQKRHLGLGENERNSGVFLSLHGRALFCRLGVLLRHLMDICTYEPRDGEGCSHLVFNWAFCLFPSERRLLS